MMDSISPKPKIPATYFFAATKKKLERRNFSPKFSEQIFILSGDKSFEDQKYFFFF